ncbi:unnamed protein product [Peronospora farinosa]|uniref:LIM zinc-binding domain-containing protein n=1 Tax=Peronospora farinosa TaxID=134698 RepID=A0AAV0SQB4_9STRA|nr:unnamed protein product [Peronospora farinosa]CAI5705745.1 unnamed protein product [Peronospora farinosa]
MTWTCMQCKCQIVNESAANCDICNALRVLECPTCKNDIKYGKRLHVNGKTYHPDCFCCNSCKKPLSSRFQVVNGSNYHPECASKSKTMTKITTTKKEESGGTSVPNNKCKSKTNVKTIGDTTGHDVAHGDGWRCSTCTFFNINDAASSCAACDAVRIFQCSGCQGEIKYGARTNVNGKVYHPDCFRCTACHEKFTSNKFQVKDGEFYDYECYKQLFHPRCDVCEDFIPYEPGTQKISFKVMPFSDLKYCAEHENCDRCCSCQRVEPKNPSRQFHSLSDGRKVCHDCCKYFVLDTKEAEGVVKEVWAYMKSIGINLPEIPVYLVESPVLNEHRSAHKKALMNGNKPVKGHETRGLCLSEVSQIQHMVRSGKQAVRQVASIEKTRSVNAILILHGLPYDLTASILVHEATHAFIKLSDDFPDHIPPKIEEGMCQLMSYLFLKYKHMMESKNSKKRTYEGRLRKFYKRQLQNDVCPIYGDGFREAYAAYKRVNSLQKMFDAIRHNASFP